MALFDDSQESRTERPTERRRRQARERGLVAHSRELLIAARTLAIWIVLAWWFASFAGLASSWVRSAFQHAGEISRSTAVLSQLRDATWRSLITASSPLLIATSAILLAHFLQVGWLWRWDNLVPQATRISPLSGLQRLFSSATIGRSLDLSVKLILVLGVSTLALEPFLTISAENSPTNLQAQFANFASGAIQIVSQVAIALALFSVLDYGRQRWRFERSLLMTREEVREELKDVEGNPHLKNQRHALAHQVPRANSSVQETNARQSSSPSKTDGGSRL